MKHCKNIIRFAAVLAGFVQLQSLLLAGDDLLVFTDYTNKIYGNLVFNNGWHEYGWGTRFTTNDPVHSGTMSYCLSPTGGYQAISLIQDDLDTSLYTNLTFWINGGASGGQSVGVNGMLSGVEQPRVSLGIKGKLPTNSWLQVSLPLATLGCANKTNFDGIRIWSNSGNVQSNFFIDDVVLYAAPPPALVHVNVNANQTVRTVDPRVFAVNAAAWDGNLDTTNTINVLTNMGNQALRWPGGSWSDEYHWANEANSVGYVNRNWGSFSPNFIHVATNTRAQVFIICNYGSSTPEAAAFGVRMFNVTNHCAFKYWEVGNENYGSWERDDNTNAPFLAHDPWTYAMRFTNYYAQMKAIDPTIKIGAVVVNSESGSQNNTTHFAVNPRTGTTNYGWTPVVLATLKSLGVTPDFLIDHEYGPDSGDTAALLWSKNWTTIAANLRQMLNDYLGPVSTNVELNVTENGNSGNDRQRSSLVSGLFYADSLGQVLQTEINTRLWWDLRNGPGPLRPSDPALYGWRTGWFTNVALLTNTLDYYSDEGVVNGKAEPTNCYPTYYAAKLLTHFARGGDTVIKASSDHPLLGVYAVKQTNGALNLLVINKSCVASLIAAVSVAGYLPVTNAAVYSYGIPQDDAARTGIGSPDLAQSTFNSTGVNFTNSFPPFSLTVLALSTEAVVIVAQDSTWVGNVNNRWDVNTTTNWQALGFAGKYNDGAAVLFDDTALTNTIDMTTVVYPTATLVNTTNTYTFGGVGLLGGGSLTKTGTGTLIVSNNNTFNGGTVISGGTLKLGTSSALNNAAGWVIVTNSGALDFNSTNSNPNGLACTISGAGFNGLGTLVNNLTNAQTTTAIGPGSVSLAGSATIGGTNRWDLRSGANTFYTPTNAYALTKAGAGIVGFNGTTVSSNLGDIYILRGSLAYEGATTRLGNPTNTIYVANGATLRFNNATVPLDKSIVCSNGAAIGANGGNATNLNIVTGPVKLDSGTINLNLDYYNAITFSNVLSGAGGLALQYQSIVKLAGTNNYTGNTTLGRCNSAGAGIPGTRLALIGNGSIANSARITLQGIQTGQAFAANLDVLERVDGTLTLASNQTLQGDNGSFVRGTVVVAAGSTIQPGGISTNFQYMSVSNVLTFQAGSTNHMDLYKTATLSTNDLIIVGSQVNYGGTLRLQTNGTAALVVGDTFKLFAAPSFTGNFTTIADASGATWSFNPMTGMATVIALPSLVSTNACLTSLVLSPAGTLAPAFATNGLSYTATEAYGNTPTVTVVNADLTATNRLVYNNTTNLLASGGASAALTLNPNPVVPNVATVQVTAQDGVTLKSYVVNVTQLPSQTKPVLTHSVSGGLLLLNWPLDHLGYRLQAQTNQLDVGLNPNWFTWPDSTNINTLAVPLDQANPGMFFRLVYP